MRKDLDTTVLADWDSLGVTVKVCVFVMRDAKHHNQEANNSRTELMSFRFTGSVIRRDRHTSREKIYSIPESLLTTPG